MLNKILTVSLNNRMIVLIVGLIITIAGVFITQNMEVDIFPDLNAPTVVIMTEAKGMAPEEVEKMVTYKIETAVNGSPHVRRVRSNSVMGLSIVWVDFDWGVNVYFARQSINEKLSQISGELPVGVTPPMLAPQASLLGEIMIFAISSDTLSNMELRTYADWSVKPRLLSLGGIAQIIIMGGEEKQYQIQANLEKMKQFGVSLQELEHATANINENSNGGILNQFGNEYVIRGITKTDKLGDLANSVIKVENKEPIKISDVADIKIDFAPRINDASYNAKQAIIVSVVKQSDISTVELTRNIIKTLKELEKNAPAPITIHTEPFNQSNFIETSIGNVSQALLEGSLFVVIILFLFLLSVRTTFISVIAIPISLLTTLIIMKILNISINTMSLGGMAIAIGSLVDDAIIDVENVYKRLKENFHKPIEERASNIKVIFNASMEIRASIINATLIIIVAFSPLFFLSGIEGRLLQPLGIAYIISLIASLIVSITITPILCSFLLTNDRILSKSEIDNKFVSLLKRVYAKLLSLSFKYIYSILLIVGIILIAALASFFFIGRNFLPAFNEASLTIQIATTPGISLEESSKIGVQVEREILKIPEVISTSRKTGRAELSEHSFGSSVSEIEVPFILKNRPRAEFINEVRTKLSSITGIVYNIGQPISHRIDHIISGAKTSIAIKLYGDDLDKIFNIANKIKSNIADIAGIADLNVEQIVNVPQIHIIPDRVLLANYGITIDEFNSFIQTALAGKVIGNVYEDDKSFDLTLRLKDEYRNSIEDIGNLLISTKDYGDVSLSTIAKVVSTVGVNVVNRENVKRKILISANVEGRDVRSVVNDIKAKVKSSIQLPNNYYIEYGGQFESEEKASRTILLVSLVSLLIIFFLLHYEFQDYLTSLVILANLPLALIGGIATLWLSSGILSIPSLIGFITLFGIATRNGILMVSRYHHLLEDGMSLMEAIMQGSLDRLNPVLMTALTAALALIPLVIAGDKPGNEIQSPMAEVILGGLFSSTLLNLVVVPIVYFLIMKWRNRND
ncbi:MAG TPA: efflux RND transporter permease subunit [Candidatus Kapabacteria bacterium]|nr:efflux RND transporter permease subunit [Candidatus Kapabacteria bacterium]